MSELANGAVTTAAPMVSGCTNRDRYRALTDVRVHDPEAIRRFTGYDAKGCADMGLNGGKTLTRIALDDPGTLNTMTATATAINELGEHKLMAMAEPFWSSRVDGKARKDLSANAVIKYPADDDVAAAVDTAASMVR